MFYFRQHGPDEIIKKTQAKLKIYAITTHTMKVKVSKVKAN